MKVHEIFKSISGEVAGCPQGSLATFIRFSKCNLNCTFCDAPDARTDKETEDTSLNLLLNLVNSQGLKNIIITGGEPLLQDRNDLCSLVNVLALDFNKNISIETNGSMIVPNYISKNCTIVMDYKLDQQNQMNLAAFKSLRNKDFIKFVITNRSNLLKAIKIQKRLITKAQFAYSPVMPINKNISEDLEGLKYSQKLANSINEMLQKNKLEAIINIQIHKILDLA